MTKHRSSESNPEPDAPEVPEPETGPDTEPDVPPVVDDDDDTPPATPEGNESARAGREATGDE